MNKYLLLVILSLWSLSTPRAASPTGQQLLDACETAFKKDLQGTEALFCEWYATPCDCEALRPADAPPVCLPENYDVRELSRKLLTGLRAAPELKQKQAATAAAIILARDYPCKPR